MRQLFIFIILLGISPLVGQRYTLRVLVPDRPSGFVQNELQYQLGELDSVQIANKLAGIITTLHERAYAEAGLDSLLTKDSTAIAFIHAGEQYQWGRLSVGQIPVGMMNKIGFSQRKFAKNNFSPATVHNLRERLLTYAGNNGYPFATVWLDSFRIKNKVVDAQLLMDTGPFITVEDIKLEGGEEAPVNAGFLRQYLGIKPGMPYNQQVILDLVSSIEALPYLKLKKSPFITFFGHSALIHLNLAPKNASRFDFLIGVLPNSNPVGREKRILLTGSFDMQLVNQLKRGELLAVKVEQLRPLSPRMQIKAAFPYVFKTSVGADLDFSLYKRDTNYIDVKYELGAKYLLSGTTSFTAFYNRQSSNLITVDTQQVKQLNRLPDTLDVRRNFYGLAFEIERLDYRYNPSKGWHFYLKFGAGTRKININNQIQSIGLDRLYDDLVLSSFQYKTETEIATYLTLFPSFVVKSAFHGGLILNKAPILANEQYRIGGNRLLRGFDEESVFATNYAVATLELRLLLDRNSNLYLFTDLARIDERTKRNLPEENTIDKAIGFGAGVTFATKAGLFGISLAYGSRKGNPIDFGTPKVHLGFVFR